MPSPGLTAGRVIVKNTLPVAPARTALLTDLRRWPGDGFFGQNTEVGNPTLVYTEVGLDDSFDCFPWEESQPWRRLGRLEASMRAGMWRARYRSRWASHQTRLGEPVAAQTRTHWASHQAILGRAVKQGWGEPSNEVGRASTKGPLGEPVLRAVPARRQKCPLGYPAHAASTVAPLHLHSGLPLVQRPPLSQWPTPALARCACSAHLQVPARRIYLGACSAHLPRCLLGTVLGTSTSWLFCTVLHAVFCMTCGTACFLHDTWNSLFFCMTCGTACTFFCTVLHVVQPQSAPPVFFLSGCRRSDILENFARRGGAEQAPR